MVVKVCTVTWTWPINAEAPLAKGEYLDPKLHRVEAVFSGLDAFPATLRLLRDLDCGAWKGCLKGIGCVWRTLHVHYLHPLKAALLKSTAARFSRLFDQQACLYIHKLTPPAWFKEPCARIFAQDEDTLSGECQSSVLLGGDHDSWKWEVNYRLSCCLVFNGRFGQGMCFYSPSWNNRL